MTVCSSFVVFFFLLKRGPFFKRAWEDTNPVEVKGYFTKALSILAKVLKVLSLSLKSIDIVYYITYGVLAVVGTIFHSFFFAFHLTEVLFR